MRKSIFNILAMVMVIGLLIGCAAAPVVKTPSGHPEVTINSADTELIKSVLIDKWMSLGYSIETESSHRLLMSKILEGNKAIMAQMMFGNSYSTTPKVECDFSIYTSKGKTRVMVTPYVSTQMAMGQTRRESMTQNGDVFNQLYSRLLEVKSDIENQ